MSTSSRKLWLGRGLAIALVAATIASIAGGSVARKDSDKEKHDHGELRMMTRSEALEADAKDLAADTGYSLAEAKQALLRQPRVGDFQVALRRRGPASFGGLHLDYKPKYGINLLAPPGHGRELKKAAGRLGFDDLMRYVVVTETPYTEDVLRRASARAGAATPLVLARDIRIQYGRVLVWTRPQRVGDVRAALARANLGIPVARVTVIPGVGGDEHAHAGLDLNHPNENCTSGFTVRRTSDGAEGATTAAHCRNGDGSLAWTFGHHGDLPLTFMQGLDGEEQDVQWYLSPGINDWKSFQADLHDVRPVLAKKGRAEMNVDDYLCNWGRATNRKCGWIASKDFVPPFLNNVGRPHSATFISMRGDDADTAKGDSGGPWFSVNTAYGFHTGSMPGSTTDPIANPTIPYFMAQNFTEALGVRVVLEGQ